MDKLKQSQPQQKQGRGPNTSGSREFTKNTRRRPVREDRRPEFAQKILAIRRVTRVAAGGRRFSFSVAIVIGDKKGRVGVGTGKAGDTSLAIEKAIKNAKKNMISASPTKSGSIPHEIAVKYSSARIALMPSPGKGLVAGSAVRDVLSLAGLRDVVGKVFSGSKNKLNIAQATVKALTLLSLKSRAPKALTESSGETSVLIQESK
ncbi:MAG: 30S ribosomal protein S5 [bacterium]|nr:30S ribosomal protein S5 [bacterium]